MPRTLALKQVANLRNEGDTACFGDLMYKFTSYQARFVEPRSTYQAEFPYYVLCYRTALAEQPSRSKHAPAGKPGRCYIRFPPGPNVVGFLKQQQISCFVERLQSLLVERKMLTGYHP